MNYEDELQKRDIEMTFYYSNNEKNALILCPFHNDVNPSLSVNLQRGQFHCFACGESGPFYKLIAQLDDVPEKEAKKLLKEEETVQLTINRIESSLNSIAEEEQSIDFYSLKSFHKYFIDATVNDSSKNYLLRRKIKLKTAKKFDLRFSTFGRWRNRIIIPIYTADGKLLSWAGRSIVPTHRKTLKKRSARSALYGLYELLPKKSNAVVIVEGEFDAMYLQQCGVPAVARMGTMSLTSKQRSLLVKYFNEIVLSYDADSAGYKAMRRDYVTLSQITVTTIIVLPRGKDPNELSSAEVAKLYKNYLMRRRSDD